jgi:hypothetical protein
MWLSCAQGRWKGSALSGLQQARLRREFIKAGRIDEFPIPQVLSASPRP